MKLAIVRSRAQVGIHAPLVTVEVHLSGGLPRFNIVGLPETAVKESKERVRSALMCANFKYPQERITVSLAPADLPKEGGRFDLPIAIGILAASNQLDCKFLDQLEFIGELGLNGELRPTRSVLPAAVQCTRCNRQLIVPMENAAEAALVPDAVVRPAASLMDVWSFIQGERVLAVHRLEGPGMTVESADDLNEVHGQHRAKRALEIAAAGAHNVLLVGPPGTGKTMLSKRLRSILPPLSVAQALETAAVYSISNLGFDACNWRQRPFRAPHHTASGVALVGGGGRPKPGEISLAHNGVLFLDELPEFSRHVLEVLREPLESGHITISRAAHQVDFPARFQLIAAMNPCPCGYLGDSKGRCRCSEEKVERYHSRISGPLLDRIDLHVAVPRVRLSSVLQHDDIGDVQSSAQIRTRVQHAHERQLARAGTLNAYLRESALAGTCNLPTHTRTLFDAAVEKLGLSARAWHRVLKVARTIADLADADAIQETHLSEALSLRTQTT